MDKSEIEAQIEGARAYESLFIPALSGQWAGIVANALGVHAGQNVLDVACGTGVLSTVLAESVLPTGSLTGVDPNIEMLTVASEKSNAIEWKQGVAESLPFENDTFDSVGSQFGFMFFQDHSASIKEILRVTKPNGSIAVAVWDSIENIPGYQVERTLIEKVAGTRAGAQFAAIQAA